MSKPNDKELPEDPENTKIVGLARPSCSAVDLLREEADRLGGVMQSRPSEAEKDLISNMRWAYSVAAAFLESRSDGSCVRQYFEAAVDSTGFDPESNRVQRDKVAKNEFMKFWKTTPKEEPAESIAAWKSGWDAAVKYFKQNVKGDPPPTGSATPQQGLGFE